MDSPLDDAKAVAGAMAGPELYAEMINRDVGPDLGLKAVVQEGQILIFEDLLSIAGSDGLNVMRPVEHFVSQIKPWENIYSLYWSKVDYDHDLKHREWVAALDKEDQILEKQREDLADRVRYFVKDWFNSSHRRT
jgi:hypothetical protein